jgi:hypothetical protein
MKKTKKIKLAKNLFEGGLKWEKWVKLNVYVKNKNVIKRLLNQNK